MRRMSLVRPIALRSPKNFLGPFFQGVGLLKTPPGPYTEQQESTLSEP